jgi:hypothetical protein
MLFSALKTLMIPPHLLDSYGMVTAYDALFTEINSRNIQVSKTLTFEQKKGETVFLDIRGFIYNRDFYFTLKETRTCHAQQWPTPPSICATGFWWHGKMAQW